MNTLVLVCSSCYCQVFVYNLQDITSLCLFVCLTGCIAGDQISIECYHGRMVFPEEVANHRLATQVSFLTFLNIL